MNVKIGIFKALRIMLIDIQYDRSTSDVDEGVPESY